MRLGINCTANYVYYNTGYVILNKITQLTAMTNYLCVLRVRHVSSVLASATLHLSSVVWSIKGVFPNVYIGIV